MDPVGNLSDATADLNKPALGKVQGLEIVLDSQDDYRSGWNWPREDPKIFQELLQWEILVSNRYRRYFTLLQLKTQTMDSREMKQLLLESYRDSDSVHQIEKDSSIIVVIMSETDRMGAWRNIQRTIDRWTRQLDLWISMVRYPEDGKTSDELIGVLDQRMERALCKPRWSIVDRD